MYGVLPMCYSLFIPRCSRNKKAILHKSRASRIITFFPVDMTPYVHASAKKKRNIRRMHAIAININVNFHKMEDYSRK